MLKLANNASSTLAGGISAAATSLTVAAGDGAKFPTLGGTDWFPLVLEEGAALEIVRATARAGDVVTITRAQEGTAALAFLAGARVDLRATVAALEALGGGDTSAALFASQLLGGF